MDKMQALDSFWNSFNLTAYDQNTVPEDEELPYITYSVSDGYLDYPVSMTASIWYRSRSWSDITEKANEISDRIGRGGVMVPYDGGAMWISKGQPFMQRVADEDDSIRRIFINVEVEFMD